MWNQISTPKLGALISNIRTTNVYGRNPRNLKLWVIFSKRNFHGIGLIYPQIWRDPLNQFQYWNSQNLPMEKVMTILTPGIQPKYSAGIIDKAGSPWASFSVFFGPLFFVVAPFWASERRFVVVVVQLRVPLWYPSGIVQKLFIVMTCNRGSLQIITSLCGFYSHLFNSVDKSW